MTIPLVALGGPLRGPEREKKEAAAPWLTDAELVRRLKCGDTWAQEAVYRKHFALIWNTAVRLLANRSDAEDVLQDTFATAYDRIRTLRDPEALTGWLAQIAVRLVHRRFRRRRLLRALGLDRGSEDATLATLARQGLREEARVELLMLDRALGEIPVRHRLAWMLRYVEGYSVDEVAAACSCSRATAKRHIHAADARIRQHVDIERVVR